MTTTATIEDVYNIALSFITDQDTTILKSDTINLIKTFPGRSYLLTIYAPTDGMSHIIKKNIPYTTPEYEYSIKRGPHGVITLYCNGKHIKTYTSNHPVAPGEQKSDNFIKRFLRKKRENSFFSLINFIKARQDHQIILRNNNEIIKKQIAELSGKEK